MTASTRPDVAAGTRPRGRVRTAGLLVVAAAVAACASPLSPAADAPRAQGSTAPSAAADATPAPSVADPVVVLVSVDGLTPEALQDPAYVDTGRGFARLRREGLSTTNARTAVERTVTLPNHASMLTGRRVLGPSGTSVTVNEDPGTTLADLHGSYVPGIFDVAHDHGLVTGLYAQKPKFGLLVRSWDSDHGAPDTTGDDDGRGKLDTALISPDPEELLDRLETDLGTVRLAFLHLAAPDTAGHAHGWLSPPYVDAVAESDALVADLLDRIAGDPDLARRTTVVLTADHGGRGLGHADAASAANFTIPFYVWGRDVSPGDLYAANPARVDPGTAQLSYAAGQPVRNIDAADLALRLLDLPLLPSYADGPMEVLRTR